MMKRYKLLKDLPTFKAGDEFFIGESGNLIAGTPENPKTVRVGDITPTEVNLMAYAKETLEQFPNILTDWFEEIPRIYYSVNELGGINDSVFTYGTSPLGVKASDVIKGLKLVGNYFETWEEAAEYLEYLKAKEIIEQDAKGFKPNWKDNNEKKYYGYLRYPAGKIVFDYIYSIRTTTIHFKSIKDIKESFEKHPEEWEAYLTYVQ